VRGVIGYSRFDAEAPSYCTAWLRNIETPDNYVVLELSELEGASAPRADWSDDDVAPQVGDRLVFGDVTALITSVEQQGVGLFDCYLSSVDGLAVDELVTLSRGDVADKPRHVANLVGRFDAGDRPVARETDMVVGAPQVAFADLDGDDVSDWDPGTGWSWCNVLIVSVGADSVVRGLTAWGVRQRVWKTIINQGPGVLTIAGGGGNDPGIVRTRGNDGDIDIVLSPGEAAMVTYLPAGSNSCWLGQRLSPPPLTFADLAVAPAAWWNVARLDFPAYVGPLCRVYIDGDTEQTLEVYPAVDGWLDGAAILAWIASVSPGSHARVAIVYDQTGNGRHLNYVAAGPRICVSGVVIVTMGGTVPAMSFNGTSNRLGRADACGLTGATGYTMVVVSDMSTGGRVALSAGRSTTTAGHNVFMQEDSATSTTAGAGAATTTFGSLPAGTNTAPHYSIQSLGAGAETGTAALSVNGTAATETAEASPTTVLDLTNTITRLGCQVDTTQFYSGNICAAGLWASDISAQDKAVVRAVCAGLLA
jgi:hypothetical protein